MVRACRNDGTCGVQWCMGPRSKWSRRSRRNRERILLGRQKSRVGGRQTHLVRGVR